MMAFSERRPGSETEEDSDGSQSARPFLPRRAPRLAESYHMPEPQRRIPLFEVEKHDEDDDDDDEDGSVVLPRRVNGDAHVVEYHEPPAAEHPHFPAAELPLNGLPHEFSTPQPIPLEAPVVSSVEATDEEDDDDAEPAVEHEPAWSADEHRPGPLFRPHAETAQPSAHEAHAAEVPASLTPEAVALAAAEERVDAAEEAEPPTPTVPPTPPRNHNVVPPTPNTPPPPSNPNVVPPLPPNNNVLPPTPNTPPPPNHNNNLPPPPPPNNPNFNAPPPNGNAGNYYHINNYNVAPTVVTQVEHLHTVETRTGNNLLTWVAIVALLRERSKRKRADAELDKNVKRYQSRLETEAKQQARQEEVLKRQRAELDHANQRIDTLETRATEQQRAEKAAATLAADEAVRTAAAERFRAQRPVAEARTPAPAPTAERVVTPDVAAAEEQPQDPFAQAEQAQSIRYNAWLGTRMRKEAGREVVDTTVDYGHAYHQERRAETAATASHDDSTARAAGATSSLAQQPLGVPLPGAFNPSLPAGMTNPALPPDARPPYSDPQSLLPASTHGVRSAASTVVIWIIVAVLAFAAASAVRLLF